VSQLDGIFVSLEAIDHRRMISLPVHDQSRQKYRSVYYRLAGNYSHYENGIIECYSQIHYYFVMKKLNKKKNIFAKKILIYYKSFQNNRWYYFDY